MKKNSSINQYKNEVNAFLKNVSKLSFGGNSWCVADPKFGRVKLVEEANYNERNVYLHRKFTVRNSKFIPSGKYTFSSLKSKYLQSI